MWMDNPWDGGADKGTIDREKTPISGGFFFLIKFSRGKLPFSFPLVTSFRNYHLAI